MKWWVIELDNYIMNDSSEAHNLGQILRLLHLAPVTFRPVSPTFNNTQKKITGWMVTSEWLNTYKYKYTAIEEEFPK